MDSKRMAARTMAAMEELAENYKALLDEIKTLRADIENIKPVEATLEVLTEKVSDSQVGEDLKLVGEDLKLVILDVAELKRANALIHTSIEGLKPKPGIVKGRPPKK